MKSVANGVFNARRIERSLAQYWGVEQAPSVRLKRHAFLLRQGKGVTPPDVSMLWAFCMAQGSEISETIRMFHDNFIEAFHSPQPPACPVDERMFASQI